MSLSPSPAAYLHVTDIRRYSESLNDAPTIHTHHTPPPSRHPHSSHSTTHQRSIFSSYSPIFSSLIFKLLTIFTSLIFKLLNDAPMIHIHMMIYLYICIISIRIILFFILVTHIQVTQRLTNDGGAPGAFVPGGAGMQRAQGRGGGGGGGGGGGLGCCCCGVGGVGCVAWGCCCAVGGDCEWSLGRSLRWRREQVCLRVCVSE